MTTTLYYSPGACSMAIHVALNECGIPFDLEKVELGKGENRSSAFLKINPRGQVPVLVEDGHVMREGASILLHLLDKHRSPLLPRNGAERDNAIEWMMFANATLHPAYARCFFLMRNGGTDAQMEAAVGAINNLWKEVEAHLEVTPFIAGPAATIADILLTVIANWSSSMPRPVVFGPNSKNLFAEIIKRPSYKKALETEQVDYKAAA